MYKCFSDVCKEACDLYKELKKDFTFELNGVTIEVNEESTPHMLGDFYIKNVDLSLMKDK